jgi:hypothetical protein
LSKKATHTVHFGTILSENKEIYLNLNFSINDTILNSFHSLNNYDDFNEEAFVLRVKIKNLLSRILVLIIEVTINIEKSEI